MMITFHHHEQLSAVLLSHPCERDHISFSYCNRAASVVSHDDVNSKDLEVPFCSRFQLHISLNRKRVTREYPNDIYTVTVTRLSLKELILPIKRISYEW